MLLTGDSKYIDAWRKMLAAIRSNAKEVDGVLMYPQNFGEYSGQAGSIVPVPRDQAQWYSSIRLWLAMMVYPWLVTSSLRPYICCAYLAVHASRYDYSPRPYSQGAVEVWYWSMDPADLEWGGTRWANFLAGNDNGYVMDMLREDFEYVRTSMEGVRADVMTTDTRQSDNPNHLNPASSRGAPIGKVCLSIFNDFLGILHVTLSLSACHLFDGIIVY